jgi:hypothetical protein
MGAAEVFRCSGKALEFGGRRSRSNVDVGVRFRQLAAR